LKANPEWWVSLILILMAWVKDWLERRQDHE
jgi:hypothetical protein